MTIINNSLIDSPRGFYFFVLGFMSFFAGFVLFTIWNFIQKEEKKGDHGLLFLSLAMFAWSMAYTIEYFILEHPLSLRIKSPEELGNWVNHVFSSINSGCILMALSYFDHLPERLDRYKRTTWNKYILLFISIIVITALPHLLFLVTGLKEIISFSFSLYLDIVFSLITVSVFGVTLYSTFKNRNLVWIGYLSWVAVIMIIILQLAHIISISTNGAFSLYSPSIAKTETSYFISFLPRAILIIVFFAVAISWLYELSKLPRPSDMHLKLYTNKRGNLIIDLVMYPIIRKRTIEIKGKSKAPFKLLAKFAHCIKYGKEITPLVVAPYELSRKKANPRQLEKFDMFDHKERYAIINLLNNGDAKKKVFKEAIFEKIESGKYILRIDPDNIEIDHDGLIAIDKSFESDSFSKCPILNKNTL